MKLVELLRGNIPRTRIKYKKKVSYTVFPKVKRTQKDLQNILSEYISLLDIPDSVDIKIKFGRKAKRVLGSVRLIGKISKINISYYLCDYSFPEYVLREVILHELIHIKTGHGSTLDKTYKYAHKGGVIRSEMKSIGQLDLYDSADKWLKDNWYSYVKRFNIKQTLYIKSLDKQ